MYSISYDIYCQFRTHFGYYHAPTQPLTGSQWKPSHHSFSFILFPFFKGHHKQWNMHLTDLKNSMYSLRYDIYCQFKTHFDLRNEAPTQPLTGTEWKPIHHSFSFILFPLIKGHYKQ